MPDITAIAPDGTRHIFPDGTDMAVVDRAMKSYITGGGSKTKETLSMISPQGKTPGYPQPQFTAPAMIGQGEEAGAQGQAELARRYIQAGPRQIGAGVRDIAQGNIARGANETFQGVGVTSLPIAANVLPIGAMEAPLATGASLAGSVAGQQIGQRGATALGLNPEQAKLAGNIGNVAGGFAGAGLAPKAVPGEQPATLGMKQGGTAATVERLANRIPVASAPLKKVYGQVADNFSQGVADAVGEVTGITGDKTDLVGTLTRGAEALKSQAKEAYAPVDQFTLQNNKALLDSAVNALQADPETMRSMPNDFYDRPISALKQVIQTFEKKGERGGPQAFTYFQNAQKFQDALDQVLNSLPPELKQAQVNGDALWAQKSAMSDIAETFGKHVEGLPPAQQPAGLAKQAQGVKGASLLEALKSEPRLRQAFGDDLANAILDHTQRLVRAQSMQGGTGAGIAGGLYGTSLLARAFTGYGASTIPVELGGLYALSKVLATPAAHPFYINMLRASSLAEQDFWAKRAVQAIRGR